MAFRNILLVLQTKLVELPAVIEISYHDYALRCKDDTTYEILLQQMPSKRAPCHPFSISLEKEWLQWYSECDWYTNDTSHSVHSEQPVYSSGLSISKTLGSIVISLNNGFSIYKWKWSFTWRIVSENKEWLWEGGDRRFHFNVGVIHNLLFTFLTNISEEFYKFCVLQELGGWCQIGFMTENGIF